MALRDFEAFLRQAAANFDPNLDTTTGSPFDNKVIQPLARRLGPDPFTVDLSTFLFERLRQAYPQLATDEGDNLTDLLIKPITLLWDPVVRENTRVRRGLSFSDPTTLTLEEADSLGANFFIPRRRGRFARGKARIFFAKPQDASINQNNFVTSRGGLVFFPTSLQSIRANEMLLNVTAENLYFFEVNVVAENPGAAYNIDANELNSIANLNAAVRVSNPRRFRQGVEEEDAVSYVARLEQSLGEKSMVTLRGIAAKVLEAFPEVNRLNVVGFNDPEMQRDVISGGGLGAVVASGNQGAVTDDAEGQARSRRFTTPEADFGVLIGADDGFVLTLVSAADGDLIQDFPIARVVDSSTVDVVDQSLLLGSTSVVWSLRKKEITLSGIPGGILFPNTPNGELRINSGEIHIGGAFDIHTRASDFDESVLTISSVFDDEPILSGVRALETTNPMDGFYLSDYSKPLAQSLVSLLDSAAFEGWALQVEDGPNAGAYRVLSVEDNGSGPVIVTDPSPPNTDPVERRWRIFDQINIDLLEPKETRISGDDMVILQGSNVVSTGAGLNFDQFGVAEGDTLRIRTGPAAGDYTIISDPLVPNFDQLRVDRTLPFSASGLDYMVFRSDGRGIQLPLVRIKSIELLDASSQPQGSFIPYAKPVDVQSRSFQNPARGVKHDLRDVSLGLVSASADPGTRLFTIGSTTNSLGFRFPGQVPEARSVILTPGTYDVDAMVAELNDKLFAETGIPGLATRIDDFHFGIRPAGNGYVSLVAGTARTPLFGGTQLRTTADITSPSVGNGWASLDPAIDFITGLDTAQVIGGRNTGFYGGPFVFNQSHAGATGTALLPGRTFAEILNGEGVYFAPDVGRRVVLGSRSLGSVRVYFLEPTTFEVNSETVFELNQGDRGILRFVPDPTLNHQQIPSLPDGDVPSDGASADGGSVFTSTSQDFLLSGINEGDMLVIQNHPLQGSIFLPSEVPNLAGKTFIYSLDGGPNRTVVFVRDDPTLSPGEVSRTGIVEQINVSAGVDIANLDGNQLKLSSELPLTVVSTGTALDYILGTVANYSPARAFSDADITNTSPHAGEYRVSLPGTTQLVIDGTFPSVANWQSPITEQTFLVLRERLQRVSTTQMADQQAEAGLYYADIELISEGAGDAWNISSGEQLTVSGFKSDGYFLTTDDPNLTFSPVEHPRLVISRSILEDGVDDDPRNATQVTGQNIQITYERSSTVQNVQDFASSEVERVVCSSPLSRHLIPHFVRFDLEYFGGSDESVVLPDIEKYIRDLFPVDTLDSSDLQKIASDRGANKVSNPVTLIAIVHNVDRSIYIQRSQNSLGTTRLAAFIPDQLNVTRNVSGGAL